MNPICTILLLALYGAACSALESVPLPRVAAYMLCSNKNTDLESIDFTAEMEGYYSEILPQAKDVTSTGTAEFDDCKLDDDLTQTRIVMDGFAMFDENGDVLSQDEIRKLVTKATLRDYFEGICVDMEAFEVSILKPNAKVNEGMGSSTYWVSALCNADNPVEVAAGIAGATVAGVIIGTLLLLCICVGLFTCCCKNVFFPCC
jgi:hypothetical protein